MASLMPQGKQQYLDNSGNLLVGGKVYTYESGTSTPLATYSDQAGTTPNTNPIILNARGEATIFWGAAPYKVVLKTSTDAEIWTQDDLHASASIVDITSTDTGKGASLVGIEDSGARFTGTTVEAALSEAATSALLAASGGSALLGFLQAGTGAASRTVQSKLRDFVSVKDFGVVGDGVTDDTTALQAACTAAAGRTLLFPAGTYLFSSLTIASALRLQGAGKYLTVLRTTSATADAIVCTSESAYEFANLTIGSTVTRTAGAYVKFDPASDWNVDSAFERVNFQAGFDHVNFVDASDWCFDDCYFGDHTNRSLNVANVASPDSGDSVITNCVFDTSTATAVHIRQTSSGGLKLLGNKFLNGGYHYLGEFDTPATPTSILLATGNSFEWANTACIALSSSASATFQYVGITGNHFSQLASTRAVLLQDPGFDFLSDFLISGNLFNVGTSATAIEANRGSRGLIGQNQYVGNGSTEIGIACAAAVTDLTIAPQVFTSIATEYSGDFTGATFNPPRIESGTSSGTTSTAYAAMFISTAVPITFAKAFAKAPVVDAVVTGTSAGGVSVIIQSITTTGFSATAVGVTSGGVVGFSWHAAG